jgi:outer membrane protein assembly complex protein YaeT
MKFLLALITLLVSGEASVPVFGQGKHPQKALEKFNDNTSPAQATFQVQFIGNTKFTEKELRTTLSDPLASIQKQGLTVPLADDTAYYLEIFYRRHGYPAVDVKYNIQGIFLNLNITEGPYYKLGGIYFEGNKTFGPDALKEYMIGTTRSQFSQFQKELPFVESDLVTGTTLLQSFYVSQGFPQVEIVKLTTRPDNRRGVIDATVTLKEGPRFYFGPITFSGSLPISETEFYSKTKPLTDEPKPYSEAELQNLQRDLTFSFKEKGYYTASVNAIPNFQRVQSGRVPIMVNAVPGPLYTFGTIIERQEPTAYLKPYILPKRFSALQGQLYDPNKLRETYRKLYLTGLFDNLNVQEIPQSDNSIQLLLAPQEAKAKELGFYGGYNTFDGTIVGANYVDRNINGRGHIFSVLANYTSRGPSGEISYENPWFLNTDLHFRTVVGASLKDLDNYSVQNYYAQSGLVKTFRKGIDTGIFIGAKQASIDSILVTPESLIGPTNYQLITAGLTQTFDFRDTPTNPHHGWIIDTIASYSKSSDGSASFARVTGRYSTYLSFGKTLLALGVRIGYIVPSGATAQVPIDERFFNGGATTVRSFYELQLSPKDNNNHVIGGLARSVFNAEYEVPIYGDLFGAVFIDAGGTGNTPLDNFSTGIGGGFRYNLPIGPVRVDYAVNPARRKNESQGVFSLSFGVAF